MTELNNESALFKGDDFYINDNIKIRQPTLREIFEMGDLNYLSLIYTITATPYDMIIQITELGIDYTVITEFQWFCYLIKYLNNLDILFGDLDFSSFKVIINPTDNTQMKLVNKDGVEINEYTYKIMAEYIRKVHFIKKNKDAHVLNDFAKEQMIEDAYNDLKSKQKNKSNCHHSYLLDLASSMAIHNGFKYNNESMMDLKVYAFLNNFKRIQMYEAYQFAVKRIANGTFEEKDIKKLNRSLNWMGEIQVD